MEVQPHFGPPGLNVEHWIDRGKTGSFFTGKGSTPDVAHWEFSRDHATDVAWVREYVAGRREFQSHYLDQARSYDEANQPAYVVVAARLAKEIPYEGDAWVSHGDTVVRALEKKEELFDGTFESFAREFRGWNDAHQEAFNTPLEVQEELQQTIAKNRAKISMNDEVAIWTECINAFGGQGKMYPAGVAALELAEAHARANQTEQSSLAYQLALGLLNYRAQEVSGRNPARSTAEMSELRQHAIQALCNTVRLFKDKASLEGESKELMKSVVTDLLDISQERILTWSLSGSGLFDRSLLDQGEVSDALFDAYYLLAVSSGLREKRVYRKAMEIIQGRKKLKRDMDSCGRVDMTFSNAHKPLPLLR